MIIAKEFCTLHSLSLSLPSVLRCAGHPHIHKIGTRLYVDDRALHRRREFYSRVSIESQDIYYILDKLQPKIRTAEHLSAITGKSVSNWTSFQSRDLWSSAYYDRSLLDYKINYSLWIYWRTYRYLLRR